VGTDQDPRDSRGPLPKGPARTRPLQKDETAVSAKFENLLERMQEPTAREGLEAAFHTSPEALGQAAANAVILRKSSSGALAEPERQLWTLAEPHRSAIARGMAWAAGNPPRESDPDLLLEQAQHPPGKSARGKKS
jgi:hypothetical protein